jgi:hypothetical protein
MVSATKLAAPLAEPRTNPTQAGTDDHRSGDRCRDRRQQGMQPPYPGEAVLRALFGIPIHAADRGIHIQKRILIRLRQQRGVAGQTDQCLAGHGVELTHIAPGEPPLNDPAPGQKPRIQ